MEVLLLEGSPRERGRTHGESLRPLILRHVNIVRNDIESVTGTDPDQYIEQFLCNTDLLSAIRRWTPDLLEEVEGIAEGAGLDHEPVLMLQLLDEEWWYRREKGFVGHARPLEHCSSLGVVGDGDAATLVGQNLDLPPIADGLQALLYIREPAWDAEYLVFTLAGMVAGNGLSNRGLGVCVNTLFQLDHSSNGLPVACVVRGALAQATVADAVWFLRRVRHASGQNYVIGDRRQVVSLECSAHKVCEFTPGPDAKLVYHSNHPLANDDQEMYQRLLERLSPQERYLADQQQVNSEVRYGSLKRLLESAPEQVSVDAAKGILSSHDPPEHSICQHERPDSMSMTVGCTIMELSSDPALHLAPGPPCSSEFMLFRFRVGPSG
jgi:isopenicillin-N N-acyltransferase-like protein